MKRGMKDRRYRRTEEVILKVFFKEDRYDITMVKMAEKTGLGRSTIYTHHRAIKKIIPDYEKYILMEYGLTIKKRLRLKEASLRGLYLDTLVFVLRNRKIFEMFLKFDDREVIMQMIKKLEPKVSDLKRLPKHSEKIFRVYASEVVEIIFAWGKDHFSEKEFDKVLFDIMYLTETCKSRLMPIE